MLFVICWIFTLPSGGVVCLMCILFLHSPTGSYLSYYLYLKMFSRNPVRSTSFECRYLFSHQGYEFFVIKSIKSEKNQGWIRVYEEAGSVSGLKLYRIRTTGHRLD